MIVRAGAAHDPKGKNGLAMLTATLLDQGAGKQRRADRRDDRLRRWRAWHRSRLRPELHQRRRDEGQLRRGSRPDGRRRAAADFRGRRDRAAAATGTVGAEGRGRRSGVDRGPRDRPADLRLPSVRHAWRRHAGVARRADASRLRGFPQEVFRAEQRAHRRRRRHRRGRSDGRASRNTLAPGRPAKCRHRRHRSPRCDPPRSRDRQEGRRPDRRSASATSRFPASTTTTKPSTRRSRFLAAKARTVCNRSCDRRSS